MHILPNLSQSQDNQTITFGQVKEYNKWNIFLAENEARRLVSGIFVL